MRRRSVGAVNEPFDGAPDGARQSHGGVRVDRRLATVSMIVSGKTWSVSP